MANIPKQLEKEIAPAHADIDLAEWVDASRRDPVEYLRRQGVEVAIHAISRNSTLRKKLFLKGGTLMALAYQSPRETTDVDFTVDSKISEKAFNAAFQRLDASFEDVAREIGYPRLKLKVQSNKRNPNKPDAKFPTYQINIGIAERGSHQEDMLRNGNASNVVKLEISLNEVVGELQVLSLDEHGNFVLGYSLFDLIAEKTRAFLQQSKRNRRRRQDIYDLARLIRANKFDAPNKQAILKVLIDKSKSRGIFPGWNSIDDKDLIDRAKSEYHTLAAELEGEQINFDKDYEVVREFYKSLPWPE